VQLGVWGLGARDAAGGGVAILGCDHVLGVLFHDLAAVAAAHNRHLLSQVVDGLLDRAAVGLLDLLALPRITKRPHRRNGLWSRERHVDPTSSAAAGALRAQPSAGAGVAALHQRDEVRAIHRPARLDSEPRQRLLVGQPPAGGLRQLAGRGQVVVPALGLYRLALQVARVSAASGRTYARRSHHISDDRQRAQTATDFVTQRSHSARTVVHLVCAGGAVGRGGERSEAWLACVAA
jgi:hypothetical protein